VAVSFYSGEPRFHIRIIGAITAKTNSRFAPVRHNPETTASIAHGFPPEAMAAARGTPAHKFIWRTVDGVKTYSWYDPASCGCVYRGDQAAYEKFRHEMLAQHLMYEEELGESQR
jgi:hypothetical protein